MSHDDVSPPHDDHETQAPASGTNDMSETNDRRDDEKTLDAAVESTLDAAVDTTLDAAVEAVRADGGTPQEAAAAASRVLERLRAEGVAGSAVGETAGDSVGDDAGDEPSDVGASDAEGSGCDAIRAELRAHREGSLSPARAALVRDHLGECLACRRAWRGEAERETVGAAASGGAAGAGSWRWLAAAAVLVGAVGLAVLALRPGATLDGHVMRVASLEGRLLAAGGEAERAHEVGDVIEQGEAVRTARGARATLELPDGSLLELNERSQVALRAEGDATIVDLARGDVIVRAAERRERSLLVRTDELSAAVKGTIFTVGHGLRGSRVAVLEGSVAVDDKLLKPGDQVASRPGLGRARLADQVRWSREADEYLALISEIEKELQAVVREMDENPLPPNVRHESELLEAMPLSTVFYVGIPNAPAQLAQMTSILDRRLSANPKLSDWWNGAQSAQRAQQPSVRDVVEQIQALSDSIGDEVALGLALPQGPHGGNASPVPVLIARVIDEQRVVAVLDEIFARANVPEDERPRLRRLDPAGLRSLGAAGAEDLVLALTGTTGTTSTTGTHVVLGTNPAVLADVAERLAGDAPSVLADSPFLTTLDEHYRRGTEFVAAIDLDGLVDEAEPKDATADRLLDPQNLRHFILATEGDGNGRAVLSFHDERQGLAGWLADPAPMGSLEFVSPDAKGAFSVAFQDPAAMLEDLEVWLADQSFGEGLRRFTEQTGLDLSRDLAEPLGGELTVALDGPLLPEPAWKIVAEVYDPDRLQASVETLVERANEMRSGGVPLAVRASATAAGPAWSLDVPGAADVHWAYVDGYVVVSPSLGLLEATLQQRRLGANLPDSPRFTKLLPAAAEKNVSVLLYGDVAGSVGALVQQLGRLAGQDASGSVVAPENGVLALGVAGDREISFEMHGGDGPLTGALRHLLMQGLLGGGAAAALGYDAVVVPPTGSSVTD